MNRIERLFTRFTMYQFNFQQAMDSCFLNVVHALIYTGFFSLDLQKSREKVGKNINCCCSNNESTQKRVYKKSRVCFFRGLMSSGFLADKKEVCLMSLTLCLNKTNDIHHSN